MPQYKQKCCHLENMFLDNCMRKNQKNTSISKSRLFEKLLIFDYSEIDECRKVILGHRSGSRWGRKLISLHIKKKIAK